SANASRCRVQPMQSTVRAQPSISWGSSRGIASTVRSIKRMPGASPPTSAPVSGERPSTTVTSHPFPASRFAIVLPMKPAPPRTTARLCCLAGILAPRAWPAIRRHLLFGNLVIVELANIDPIFVHEVFGYPVSSSQHLFDQIIDAIIRIYWNHIDDLRFHY